ncbi:hypothetical protein [Paenibacillus sp. Aloe-11]|nr:hypothetical protein [Paenibacillus sp. Aloe-11]
MIEKPLFKVNSNSLHIPQVNPDQEEVLQQEVYSSKTITYWLEEFWKAE